MITDRPKEWIQSYTGQKFYPLHPSPETIQIKDIAHHLSMICRYTGAVMRFYSVAEHCVRVSLLVGRGYPEIHRRALQRWGLLHDASEAYIADVSRPVKHQPELAGYREIEKALQRSITDRFGLPPLEPPEVKRTDMNMLGIEAVRLFRGGMHPDWAVALPEAAVPGLKLPLGLAGGGRLGWAPEDAERKFLRRFKELFPEMR